MSQLPVVIFRNSVGFQIAPHLASENTTHPWRPVHLSRGRQMFGQKTPLFLSPRNYTHPNPDAPCIKYLPTLGEKWPHSKGNVGKYSLHGASGKVLTNDSPIQMSKISKISRG